MYAPKLFIMPWGRSWQWRFIKISVPHGSCKPLDLCGSCMAKIGRHIFASTTSPLEHNFSSSIHLPRQGDSPCCASLGSSSHYDGDFEKYFKFTIFESTKDGGTRSFNFFSQSQPHSLVHQHLFSQLQICLEMATRPESPFPCRDSPIRGWGQIILCWDSYGRNHIPIGDGGGLGWL